MPVVMVGKRLLALGVNVPLVVEGPRVRATAGDEAARPDQAPVLAAPPAGQQG
jgi:hypothetical protein